MDPNETLQLMRKYAQRIIVALDNAMGGCSAVEYQAGQLAELTQSLDTWIQKGGFLPDEWTEQNEGDL